MARVDNSPNLQIHKHVSTRTRIKTNDCCVNIYDKEKDDLKSARR